MKLNIVLVEPRIPQNVGNISRTCAATGANLHLVEPMGFTITDSKLKRAGLDYWDMLNITVYADIEEFFEKNEGPLFFFTTKAKEIYTKASFDNGCYLVFGREDAGLDEPLLLSGKGKNIRLPMIEDARSLNLSNAVAIAAYEALRQNGFDGLLYSSPRKL